MDFQIIDKETLRIKGKKASLAIDPKDKITKFDADAIVSTDKKYDESRVNDYRVIIEGPGEFEVSGLKVRGVSSGAGTVFEIISDGTGILVARASAIEKLSQEKLDEYKIVVINADSELNQSLITAMEPRVVILYGELKKEGAKKLGNESVAPLGKISLSEDKLPEELEIILLG